MVSIYFRINRSSVCQNESLSNVLEIYARNYLAFLLHKIKRKVSFCHSLTPLGECNNKNVAKDCIKYFEIQETNFILCCHTDKRKKNQKATRDL